MRGSEEFLSCDWGTSSFRLRWVRGAEVVREHRDASGTRSMWEAALAEGDPTECRRGRFYSAHIRRVLGSWRVAAGTEMPLVISGMASSSVGWRELPYARLPFALDGSSLVYERILWEAPPVVNETYLVSGAASEVEMMRGEETQAIGIVHQIGEVPDGTKLILPGTHSKHLTIEHGRVQAISTYMTGELFDVLARHSLLQASVRTPESAGAPDVSAFQAGVRSSIEDGMAASLFRTRTRTVLNGARAEENTWFLSGVLIGAEIADMLQRKLAFVYLAAAGQFRDLYPQAMEMIVGQRARWEVLSTAVVENAMQEGHRVLLDRIEGT